MPSLTTIRYTCEVTWTDGGGQHLATIEQFDRGEAPGASIPLDVRRGSGERGDQIRTAEKTAEAVALLEASRVAYAHQNTVQGYLAHPVLADRDRWRSVGTPNGPDRALLPPATLPGVPSRMDPVPALGVHTGTILAELGYSATEVNRMRSTGAV